MHVVGYRRAAEDQWIPVKIARIIRVVGRLLGAGGVALLLGGCALHYDVTLGNGNIVRAKTKPRLNAQGFYVFKDLSGREVTVNPMRVRQIQAVRPGSRPSAGFLDPVPGR
jgi:hypothetical protein